MLRAPTPADGTQHVLWDPTGDGAREAADQAGHLDGVVHLAGAGIADQRWSAKRKEEILQSRTRGTTQLVAFVRSLATAPQSVLTSSAIGIYGSRGDDVLTEASDGGQGFLADVCRAWEEAASPLVRDGLAVATLRTGIVLSPHGGALAKQLPLFRAGLGGSLGNGRQWLSPIALTDHLRAMDFLLTTSATGAFNLTAPEPVTNARFTKALGAHLRRPTFARVPETALRLALGAELADEALLASQRVVPERLLSAGFTFVAPRVEDILRLELASR